MNDYLFEQTDQGSVLTKVLTSPTHAVIPEMADGRPVYAIGKYAFEGQSQLESVHFPATVREIRSHAFYNCTNLNHLMLEQGIHAVSDGAFKNCRSLHQITMNGMKYIEQFLSDSTLEVTVTMHFEDGQTAVLLFPEYDYTYVEMVQPRGFQAINYGSGSFYRLCFYRSQIDFSQYDRTFPRAVQNDTTEVMISVAALRLQYPYQLHSAAKERYLSYLTEHAYEAAELALNSYDMERLELLIQYKLFNETVTQDLISLCAQQDFPEAVSLLMDYRLTQFGNRRARFIL